MRLSPTEVAQHARKQPDVDGSDALGVPDLAELNDGESATGVGPDEKAQEDFRKRLKKLAAERKEAEEEGDALVLAAIDEETRKLSNELTTGKHSNEKGTTDDKNRSSVAKAIRRALREVKEDEALRTHIETFMKVGSWCTYTPPEGTIWDTGR